MFPRLLPLPSSSFFLFGPRGTGKSSWVRAQLPHAVYVDLLESDLYTELLASPSRIDAKIPRNHTDWVVIDEVQRVPELLNEVHRLIEAASSGSPLPARARASCVAAASTCSPDGRAPWRCIR